MHKCSQTALPKLTGFPPLPGAPGVPGGPAEPTPPCGHQQANGMYAAPQLNKLRRKNWCNKFKCNY